MKPYIFEQYAEILKYPTDIAKFGEYTRKLKMDEAITTNDFNISKLQEIYVETFDFSEKTALCISQHTAKTNEEKSLVILAMAELLREYEIDKTPNAQPDYLPDVLKAFSNMLLNNNNEDGVKYLADMIFDTVFKIEKELKYSENIYARIMKRLKDVLTPFTSKQEVIYV